ncbi:MAG: hypothetical protein B6I17_01110 [Tenericutes bacterium 4572_104]|nr:MAG: hypothetical protein B6I17_01110 [Tenericutes bacterium 4572_104]
MNYNRLLVLVKGELSRLNKYNIFSISMLIAIIWGLVLFFVNATIFNAILPILLLIDATLMSIIYIGSVMFFEKSESTISTMLVTPSTNKELIFSKVLANSIHNTFSSILIIIVFIFIRDIQINYFLILIGIILTTAFHTILGFYMAYYQKSFTEMLMNVMIFSFVLMIPNILYQLNVFTNKWFEYLMLLNPIQAGTEVIGGGFKSYVFTWKYYFSLGYLIIGSIFTYYYLVIPKFKEYSIKQSGV